MILALTRRPAAAALGALILVPTLVGFALAFCVMLNLGGVRTRSEHAVARADIDRQAPGSIALLSGAASRGTGSGRTLWAALIDQADHSGTTLILQTSGAGRIEYYATGGYEVADRVPSPTGDRVLMVRWPRQNTPES